MAVDLRLVDDLDATEADDQRRGRPARRDRHRPGSDTDPGSGSGSGTDGAVGAGDLLSVWRMTAPPCKSLADTGRVMDDRDD